LKEAVKKFLGNCKDPDFEKIVGNMLWKLEDSGSSSTFWTLI